MLWVKCVSLNIEMTPVQLVDLIYACLLGEAEWQSFLDRLSGMLPGGKSVFFFHDAARNAGGFSLASGLEEKYLEAYNDYYSLRNPWMKRAAVRPVGLGVVAEQMLDRSDLLRTEYYWDFLRSIEGESAVGVTVFRDGVRSFNLSTLTDQADPDKNMAGARVLTTLAPHLQRAFHYYRSNSVSPASGQMTLLDAAGIGLLLVGPSLTVLSANEQAEELLYKGQICRLSPIGRLSLRNPDADMSLRQMLTMGSRVPRIFAYHEATNGGRAKVTLVRLNKDGHAEFFAGPTVAVLMDVIHLDIGDVAKDLLARYGLTSAEARLAQALDGGASVKDAAVSFGISEGTARQQLKAVFRKIGVTRQAELIRCMHDPAYHSSDW